MGVRGFEEWYGQCHVDKLSYLSGDTIAFDATHFLQQFRNPMKEPLVSALGGFPLGQEKTIISTIEAIQEAGIKPVFVFNGLTLKDQPEPFAASIAANAVITQGFVSYEESRVAEAINIFKSSGFPNTLSYEAFFKKILYEHRIDYCVAPYAAHGQMKYMFDRHNQESSVQALCGSTELFAYEIPMLITKINIQYEDRVFSEADGSQRTESAVSLEQSTFEYMLRQDVFDTYPALTEQDFTDCLLLTGSPLLEMFPPLRDPVSFPFPNFATVVDRFLRANKNVERLCNSHSNDPRIREVDYYDKYLRAVVAVRHMPVLMANNEVEPLNKLDKNLEEEHENSTYTVPDDLHQCIGLKLPEELHYYIFVGMISPKLPDWLAKGQVLIQAPHEGADSPEYRTLVKDYLGPWRRQSLAQLAGSINRAFQYQEMTTRYWFNEQPEVFSMREVLVPKQDIWSWGVRQNLITDRTSSIEAQPGTLAFAVSSLVDAQFSQKTVGQKPDHWDPLKTVDEFVCNTTWRFLFLRGYIDQKHRLTAWGELLERILSRVGTSQAQMEAAFIAVELIRAGLLKVDQMFAGYSSAPSHGDDADKRNCALVSKLACTGKMQHQTMGWSGPLSRYVLAYHSVVVAIRTHLRDLIESTLANILMNGDGDRDHNNWLEIKHKLPFLDEPSCGLGIVTKTVLDEMSGNPAHYQSKEAIAQFEDSTKAWFNYLDFERSLENTFGLWDAVYDGLSHAPDAVFSKTDKESWKSANDWLASRR